MGVDPIVMIVSINQKRWKKKKNWKPGYIVCI